MKNSFLLLFILSNAINAFLFIPNINSCFSRKTSASCGNIARLSLASSNSGSYSSHSACTPSKPAAAFEASDAICCFSTIAILCPLSARKCATELPITPPPIIATSYFLHMFSAHFLIDSL